MQEKLMEEMDRVLDILKKMDPTNEAYGTVLHYYRELLKGFHEDVSSCDEELNNKIQRDLDKAKQAMEEKKLTLIEQENRNKLKAAKWEAIFGLAKTVLAIIGVIVSILLTGSLEETTILSSKCLAWIKSILPKL